MNKSNDLVNTSLPINNGQLITIMWLELDHYLTHEWQPSQPQGSHEYTHTNHNNLQVNQKNYNHKNLNPMLSIAYAHYLIHTKQQLLVSISIKLYEMKTNMG